MSYSSSIEIKKEDINILSDNFYKNIISNKDIPGDIISLTKNGDLPKELRPTAWKIFFGIFPNNSNIIEWVEIISKLRIKYNKKKKKYFSVKKYKGDPLSGGMNNINKKNERNFNTLYEENELRRIINLDIIRTYQNINLFSQENIKKLLLNILFIWSKENNDISYRQGMNDLLAILILCLYPYYFPLEENENKITKDEIINCININDKKELYKNSIKIYKYFHDESEIECDLFYAFDSLMKKGMKNLFNPKLIQKNDPEYKLYEIFSDMYKDDIEEEKSNFISRRCFLLINEKLKKIDEELFLYLKKIDINCGAFLQKWLRCILCREFALNQVFILWDVILVQDFLNEKNQKYSLAFLDSICLAMIIRLRKYILQRDQNDCFSLLFKYPKIDNIKNIINLAYNIHQLLIQNKNGKNINNKIILNIADSLNEKDDELINDIMNNNKDINKIKVYTYSDNSNFNNNNNTKNNNNFLFGNYENNQNKKEENNIKNNFLENKNNNNIDEYQEKSFFGGAITSLGKIGNKLKDQLILAKDTVMNLELNLNYNNDNNENNNNINLNKESKMSDLFDLPNPNKEKENIKSEIYDEKNNKLFNIIKRLERLDNKYNKYFDIEDKSELKNIISELSK